MLCLEGISERIDLGPQAMFSIEGIPV